MGCYLQKKSKEILLVQSPTSADYLSVCSFWKLGKAYAILKTLNVIMEERESSMTRVVAPKRDFVAT